MHVCVCNLSVFYSLLFNINTQYVIKQYRGNSKIPYHVIAPKEGVYSVQVVVEELRYTVDDIEGDRLQNVHHLHVLPCGEMRGNKHLLRSLLDKLYVFLVAYQAVTQWTLTFLHALILGLSVVVFF